MVQDQKRPAQSFVDLCWTHRLPSNIALRHPPTPLPLTYSLAHSSSNAPLRADSLSSNPATTQSLFFVCDTRLRLHPLRIVGSPHQLMFETWYSYLGAFLSNFGCFNPTANVLNASAPCELESWTGVFLKTPRELSNSLWYPFKASMPA